MTTTSDIRAPFTRRELMLGSLDTGYRYGSAWLTETVPDSVLAELREL
jgi:hypothetical protein